jgi:hypothetical protein
MSDDTSNLSHQHAFWMKVAAATFGLWSIMIPLGVMMVRDAFQAAAREQAEAAADIKMMSVRFEQYVLATEKRLILVEDRQALVLRTLGDLQQKVK